MGSAQTVPPFIDSNNVDLISIAKKNHWVWRSRTLLYGSEIDTSGLNYPLGSLSKPIVALAMLHLESIRQGFMSSPLSTYIPRLGDTAIKVFHLAIHHAGLPVWGEGLEPENDGMDFTGISEKDIIKAAKKAIEEGEKMRYSYSNLGYALLSHILEKESGKPLPELIKEVCKHYFGTDQLHLCKDSTCQGNTVQGFSIANYKKGHAFADGPIAGSGFFYGNLSFLKRVVDTMVYSSNPVISTWLEPVVTSGEQEIPFATWGWPIDIQENDLVFWHSGVTNSSFSFMMVNKNAKEAFIILMNKPTPNGTEGQLLDFAAK